MSSQTVCKACILLEGLNSGLPSLGVARTRGNQHRGRRGNKGRATAAVELKLEEDSGKEQPDQAADKAAGAAAAAAAAEGIKAGASSSAGS